MNRLVFSSTCILMAFSLTFLTAGAQDQEQSVDDAHTGLSQVTLPSELSFVSPDFERTIVPQGTYDVTSPDGANLKLTGSGTDATVKAGLGTHQEPITSSSVVLIAEAGVTHVVMLLPNGTTLDAAAFPAGVTIRDESRVLTPLQIGSSDPLKELRKLQRVFQITAGETPDALLDTGLQSAQDVVSFPTQLYRATHFSSPDGGAVTLAAGPYKVERRDASSLTLVAADGSEKFIAAQASKHDEDVGTPEALSVAVGNDKHHVLLLQPDGTSLDAAGSYSGVVPRATVGVARTQLSRAQVSTAYRYQTSLRYQQLKAGRLMRRGDLQITNVSHMGPTPHLVNNPDIPVPDNLSQQTKVLDYGPNEGTVVLPRTRYAKATVTNVGAFRVVLPDQFRYLGGASYRQHRDGNTVSGESPFGAGESRIIELNLKNDCPRAPQMTSGAGYGYGLVVDPQSKLAETNEGNNAWAKAVNNPYASNQYDLADLVIDRVFFTDNTSFGGDIDMHVVVRNQGTRRAIICAQVASGGDVLWKSNNPLSAHANDNNFEVKDYSYHLLLGPGQVWDSVRSRVTSYRIPGGSLLHKEIARGCYLFSVEINPNGTVPESNRLNNKTTAYYRTDGGVKCFQKAATSTQSVPFEQAASANRTRFIIKREAESAGVATRAPARISGRPVLSTTVRASLERPDKELRNLALRELMPADQRRLEGVVQQLRVGDTQAANRNWQLAVSTMARQRSNATVDVNALIQWILRESYVETNEELSDYASKVQYFNELKNSIRQHLSDVRRQRAEWDRANSRPGRSSRYELQTMVVARSDESTPESSFQSRSVSSSSDWQAYIENLEQQLQTVGEDAQLANIDLQNQLQKQQQTLQTMSNVSKMLHDTAMAIIRKIG